MTKARSSATLQQPPWPAESPKAQAAVPSCFPADAPAGLSPGPDGGPTKLFTAEKRTEAKLVGVVVTIFQGESYDEMFREVQPTTVPGERVSTYAVDCGDVGRLHDLLAAQGPGAEASGAWAGLVEDVRQVPPDSVVFNWECCSGCGDCAFPSCKGPQSRRARCASARAAQPGGSATVRFMALALQSGFTVMCSDFSLKSLLHEWSEEHLGPNPFLSLGTCDGQICLEFVPSELRDEEVPQQLQVVGELCGERGKAVVGALPSTIVYTVNPRRPRTDRYYLKVLTVATDFDGRVDGLTEELKCTVGEGGGLRRGVAGHVTLTYKDGGQLVTSMGHWIELTRIDASVESVMRTAAHNFGAEEAARWQREYNMQETNAARAQWVQETSHKICTQSMPTRMKCRTKF